MDPKEQKGTKKKIHDNVTWAWLRTGVSESET